MVTASTDGTKMQYEQALVANFFGTAIAKDGMLGPKSEDIKESAYVQFFVGKWHMKSTFCGV